MNKVCILLVGLPAMGKTTWRKEMVAKHPFVVVSSDDYIENFMKIDGLSYDKAFKKHVKAAEKDAFAKLTEFAKFGSTIIVDRTQLTAASRKRTMNAVLKGDPDYKFLCFVFNSNKLSHAQRLEERKDKYISPDTIATMKASFEDPTFGEGFAHIRYTNIDEKYNIDDHYNVIMSHVNG